MIFKINRNSILVFNYFVAKLILSANFDFTEQLKVILALGIKTYHTFM